MEDFTGSSTQCPEDSDTGMVGCYLQYSLGFFFTSLLISVENLSEPPAVLLTCPLQSAADLRWYIELPV